MSHVGKLTIHDIFAQAEQLRWQLDQSEVDAEAVKRQLADAEEAHEMLHDSYCSLEQQQGELLQHSSGLEQQLANAQQRLQGLQASHTALQAQHNQLLDNLETEQFQVSTRCCLAMHL